MAFAGSGPSRGIVWELQSPVSYSQVLVQNTWYTILDLLVPCKIRILSSVITVADEDIECRVTIDGTVIPQDAIGHTVGQDNYWMVDEHSCWADTTEKMMGARESLEATQSCKIEIRKTTALGAGTLSGYISYYLRRWTNP